MLFVIKYTISHDVFDINIIIFQYRIRIKYMHWLLNFVELMENIYEDNILMISIQPTYSIR